MRFGEWADWVESGSVRGWAILRIVSTERHCQAAAGDPDQAHVLMRNGQAFGGLHQGQHERALNQPGLCQAVGAHVIFEICLARDRDRGEVTEHHREVLINRGPMSPAGPPPRGSHRSPQGEGTLMSVASRVLSLSLYSSSTSMARSRCRCSYTTPEPAGKATVSSQRSTPSLLPGSHRRLKTMRRRQLRTSTSVFECRQEVARS